MKDFFVFPSKDDLGVSNEGITARQYFAAKAMQAMISSMNNPNHQIWGGTQGVSHHAYKFADAMLSERNKKE